VESDGESHAISAQWFWQPQKTVLGRDFLTSSLA